MQFKQSLLACTILLGGNAVSASALDTSKPMICAATEVAGCSMAGDCVRDTPDQFNLPVLFRVDVAGKTVESVRAGGGKRASAISNVAHAEGLILLQGTDGTAGWSVTINHATGAMTVAASSDGLAFAVFGTCAAL